MMLEENPKHCFHHPIIVTLDSFTYGDRAGEKIHVKAMCYSLLGPIISFPGRVEEPTQEEYAETPIEEFAALEELGAGVN